MLSERIVTRVTRSLNQHYLHAEHSVDIARLPEADAEKRYMLYVHVPFCARICPFCPYNKVVPAPGQAERYFAALHDEIPRYLAAVAPK